MENYTEDKIVKIELATDYIFGVIPLIKSERAPYIEWDVDYLDKTKETKPD